MESVPLGHIHIGSQGVKEVSCIIRSGNLQNGATVEQLETVFAEHTGSRHAVALNSGTAALQVALQANGIGPGDEVITAPLCLPAMAAAVITTGALPVFADIDPYTYNISPREAAQAVTNRTRAILANHQFGQPCEMEALMDLAQHHSLVLIEVAWEALGARYHGKRVGSFGTSCYSFQQGMSIVTGQGGMLTTEDDQVAVTARSLADCGCDCSGRICQPGYNFCMPEVVAALALEQLPGVDSRAELQEYWAMELTHALKEWDTLVTPAVLPGVRHAFQRYALRVTPEFPFAPSAVCQKLRSLGIEAACSPLIPLHRHPFFRSMLSGDSLHLVNADRVAPELLFLPMHPYLEEEHVDRIVHALGLMATYVAEDDYKLDLDG